jgi:hypothetical protein
MNEKVKYELEFEVKSSTSVLFNMISTPSGLSEWFADDVNIKGDIFSFIWDGATEDAKLLTKKKGESIKFQWQEDVEDGLKTFFELSIKVDDLTNDVALMVTDFADEDEIDESQRLWVNQIADLKMVIGS